MPDSAGFFVGVRPRPVLGSRGWERRMGVTIWDLVVEDKDG